MSTPWLDDACSLVDAFRAKELSPLEALDACIDAIEASPLNAFSHTDFERAREAARRADVSLPFGGVPFGVKELERVEGWPYTEASVIFKDRVADHDDTSVTRLRATGAVLAAQTTAPRVRRHQLHLDRAARHDAQSLEPRTHAGRLVGRHRGRRGRRPAPDRHRERRRRLHPQPGRLQRAVRAEGDLRPDPQGSRRRPSSR